MELIREFSRIGKEDAALAGGKGASLGEMTQAGIPVPPGYVILADTFERFIEETNLNVEIDAELSAVNHEEMHTVEYASGRIQALILAAQMPADIADEIEAAFKKLNTEFVAVRSSATAEDSASAAWAGQLDTFLNTTGATLLEKVQECWASLFTPRAIFYRFEKELQLEKISVAVVVQKMVNSDAAGIAFSVHPVTEDYNQLIIEAGFGLGEAVVSGQITPDSYVVTKTPREILDKNLSEQEQGLYRKEGGGNEWHPTPQGAEQVLTDEQILALTETVIGIEKHYGFPVDTEWAMEGGVMYITQSRPITTLSPDFNSAPSAAVADGARPDIHDFVYQGRYTSSPFPSWFWFNRELEPLDTLPEASFIKKLRFVATTGTYFFTEKEAWTQMEKFLSLQIEKEPTYFARINDLLDTQARIALEWAKHADTLESKDALQGLMEQGARVATLWTYGYFASLVFDALLEHEASRIDFDPLLIPSAIQPRETAVTARQKDLLRLQQELTDNGIDVEHQLGAAIVETIQNSSTLSDFFASHLATFGWISTTNYEGAPLTLDKLVEEVIAARPVYELNPIAVPASLKIYIDAAVDAMYLHQAGAEYFSMFNYKTRGLLERIAKELGMSNQDLLLLLPSEIAEINDAAELKNRIAKRQESGWCMFINGANQTEIVVDKALNQKILDSIEVDMGSNTSTLIGKTGNKGKFTGRVRIINTQKQFPSFQKDEILVTSMTTPDFVPLMQKAAGIITDQGGLLSHAAIMSRELGKACVMDTKFATQVLHDGDLVEVNADAGIVRILEHAKDIEPTRLSKMYSRERPLFYFAMWHVSDSEGVETFLHDHWNHLLFLVPKPGERGEVRYSEADAARLTELAIAMLGDDSGRKHIVDVLNTRWEDLKGYFDGRKTISTADEFYTYYRALVDYWAPMSDIFFALPDNPRVHPEFASEVLRIRQEAEKYAEEMSELFIRFFHGTLPQFERFTYCITPEEVVELVKHPENQALTAELEVRAQEGCFMLDGHVYPMSQLEGKLTEAGITLKNDVATSSTEVTGTTAYTGKVTGPVRLVLKHSDLRNIGEGDILVTPMSNPDYVPYMKKAAAFVTDEGGMTCHAAIVSREMKKPCVIGTKFATQIFRDDDLVEVDADNGIVRKL